MDRPAEVVIRLSAEAAMNPDASGRPSPIVVNIFALGSDTTFMNTRFLELYQNGPDILGDDLLAQREVELSPGQQLTLDTLPLTLEVRHIGVIAAYRDLDQADWRAALEVQPNEIATIDIQLQRLGLRMSKAP